MFKVCLHCNTVNKESARFCRECGKAVFDTKTGYAKEGERYAGTIPERVRNILIGVSEDDPDSYCELGKMYEFGGYYVIDAQKAFECYRAADTPESMYRLGLMYDEGRVPFTKSSGDPYTAIAYITDAASRGHRAAIAFLVCRKLSVPDEITFNAYHSRIRIT